MELSKQQLKQIDSYLTACNIKYQDVKKELLDHFASILEVKLQENAKLNFHQELENIHKNFGKNGFKDLLDEKTKSVTKQFYKQSFLELRSFFTIPKIILSLALFFGLWQLMQWVDDKVTFFETLSFILIFLGFRLLFLVNIRNSKKVHFLTLDITMNFFNSFYVCVMIFNFFANFDKDTYLNQFFIHTLLFAFFLLVLFYWCGEYVFYQKKKYVEKIYQTKNL
ncbi:hypothetical protein [Polaribacter sp.]|uniref:hypothetical protein n=1 Tax=Polaribacter sp. TaxID=1920175 RepID=UPI0040475E66